MYDQALLVFEVFLNRCNPQLKFRFGVPSFGFLFLPLLEPRHKIFTRVRHLFGYRRDTPHAVFRCEVNNAG